MNDYVLQAQNLTYCYADGTKALWDITVNITRGQITAILGGNGAGKSTLFLNFNGILKPNQGKVLLNGNPVDYSRKGLKNLRKSVGIVFQDPDNQLFSASVYQDISFGAVNLGLPKEEVCKRVDIAMERTQITHLKDKPTHFLSFGQKKRVSIAGVLVMEPEVLVLDEPTAGLDPKGVTDLMAFLKEIQKELGMTIVIATHDIDMVPIYCDYAYVINEGKVFMDGTPKEILSKPDKIRSVHLRLPRIGHLMEILKTKDGFNFPSIPVTISDARKALKKNRDSYIKK